MKIPSPPATRIVSSLLLTAMIAAACQSGEKNARTAQTGPKPLIPRMWLNDSITNAEESNYLFFDTILSRKIGSPETDSIFYTLQEFEGLIDTCGNLPGITYLDIFPVVPLGTGKLSLLFVPEDAHYKPIAYFHLPEGATAFDEKADSVRGSDAVAWDLNYKNTVDQWLDPYLDSTDRYNYMDCDSTNHAAPSNTLHVSHYYHDFIELDSEASYQQQTEHPKLSGFKVFFAMISRAPKSTQKGYSNRLLPILEFTEDDASNNHRIFRIDTTGRQYQGPDFPVQATPCQFRTERGGNDNGQMCPPTCNP